MARAAASYALRRLLGGIKGPQPPGMKSQVKVSAREFIQGFV